jgi:hydrogenase nickel incorporation protein HypA/HybF
MHELAITDAIVAGVCERLGPARVRRVTLEVGALSAVMPDALRFCFDLCAKGTSLEGAVLDILEVPGRARCRSCGEHFETRVLLAECGCGSVDLDIVGGEQLLVRSVEVE